MTYNIDFHKHDEDASTGKALMEIINKVEALFGTASTFSLQMGNYTSPEYGSYKMVFVNKGVYCCTVIWDKIFGECKIYQDEKDSEAGLVS